MTKPLESFTQHLFAPITNAFTRAFTPPGHPGDVTPTIPQPAQAPPPSQTPSGAKPQAKAAQTQLSYLTAASKAAAASSGGATGKTLLGQ